MYCDDCYEMQAVHDPPEFNHEKTEIEIAELILSILSPEPDTEAHNLLHVKNEVTKWFGVKSDPRSNKAQFHDFNRFEKLARGAEIDPEKQFPCLVSFVGETGAGKSTVINGLVKVDLQHTNSYGLFLICAKMRPNTIGDGAEDMLAPVIGSGAQLDSPTSGDVHLFADVETYNTHRPLFYADCEGLNGGNSPPLATQATEKLRKVAHHTGLKSWRKDIVYANDKQRSREWAVEKLYPRILFPFSDVVCYVTRNFRYIIHKYIMRELH